jgi:hypothetical protein
LTKQEAVDKILSFSYEELSEWMYLRLCGSDKYFPVYEGHDPNLSEFLIDAFNYIKNEKFRENFLEIRISANFSSTCLIILKMRNSGKIFLRS